MVGAGGGGSERPAWEPLSPLPPGERLFASLPSVFLLCRVARGRGSLWLRGRGFISHLAREREKERKQASKQERKKERKKERKEGKKKEREKEKKKKKRESKERGT